MSGFAPVEDVSETPLGQPSGGTRHLPRKDRATGGHIDEVFDGLGEPGGDLGDALPIEPRRRGAGAGEPVERDVIEHLILAEHLVKIASMIRPGPEFLEYPRAEAGRRVKQRITDGLRPSAMHGGIARSALAVLS